MTLIILGVRARLVATGDVTITVNETRKVTGRVGEKLIRALEEADLRIPSACGGRGTCGQCRVTVLEGGGAALPTEEAVITRHAVLRGDRLACQVTIKRDMEIRVPEELLGARQWTCRVRSNANVATLLKEMVLELPPGEALEFRAGCYVLIHCPPYRAAFVDFDIGAGFRQTWERLGLQHYRVENTKETTRAYSMANYPGEDGNIIRLVIRIAIPPPARTGGRAARRRVLLSVQPKARRRSGGVGSLRPLLCHRQRLRDDLHRRWRGHGANARPYSRPAAAAKVEAHDFLLVRCPKPPRTVLPRGFRQLAGRARQLPLGRRPIGTGARGRLGRPERLHPRGASWSATSRTTPRRRTASTTFAARP